MSPSTRLFALLLAATPFAAHADDAIRQAVLDAARSQVGLVRSHESAGPDSDGRPLRVGSDRMLEFFHVATSGAWSDDLIAHLPASGDTLPSWCGIFALWAYRTAGVDVGVWVPGHGIGSVRRSDGALAFRPTASPKPGDIAYIAKNSHHALVIAVEGGKVTTIDGNTQCGGDWHGGRICERTRPRSDVHGFLSAFPD